MFRSIGASSTYTLLLLAVVNLLNYANRNVAFHHSVYSDLRFRFSLDDADLGLLGTVFMVSHALVTLPIGWLGDKWPRPKVIAGGILLWSVAAIWGAFSISYESLLASRFVAGIGCAACVPVANAILCDLFQGHRKARMVGVFNLGLFLGGVAGFAAGGLLGFVNGFLAVGIPGLFVAALVLGLQSKKDAAKDRISEVKLSWREFCQQLCESFSDPVLRWMYLGAILMAFSAGGYLAWFSEFLEVTKGLSEARAGALLGVCLVGGLAGIICGAVLSDKAFEKWSSGRQLVVALGFLLAIPCAVFALYLPKGGGFSCAAFFLMFFISWYHGPIAAAVDDRVPSNRASTTQGAYIFVMHLFGTAPSSFVVGLLATRFGLSSALLLPTATMAGAAFMFLLAARRVSQVPVIKAGS